MTSILEILRTQSATNIISLLLVVVTVSLAIAAFRTIQVSRQEAQLDRRQNQKLALEAWERSQDLASQDRQHQSRPVIVPVGEFIATTPFITRDDIHSTDGKVIWGYEGEIQLKLQNMGGGVALNVHCILYGPEDPYNLQFVSWDNGPIGATENPVQVTCKHPQWLYLNPGDSIDGIHPLFDKSLDSPSNPAKDRIACLTITYHDLFEIKHMSIFNYTLEHRWLCVKIDKIPSLNRKPPLNLKELNDQKGQPGSKSSDLALVSE